VRPEHEELLRRLALNDEGTAEAALGTILGLPAGSVLEAKTRALARVAALVAAESALTSYQWAADAALAAGASEEEVVDVLTAVAPIVGRARLATAAPQLALALGYDVQQHR
jgi:alkylhydroperoxidase/carboxymuconolactone decarboxylase family protein YurZ